MRAAILGWSALALAYAAGSLAQDRSEPARLDDFALPKAADEQPRLEQLTTRDPAPLPVQTVDRSLARPAESEKSGTMPAQLSSTGGGGAMTQLGTTRESRPTQADAVSSTKDSAPGTVTRIGGQDRCDPQLAQRFYAECLRVLELRSAEFDAPQPATLSAEQRLLAEQRPREESLTGSSAALRLRYATAMQPDADLESNQELAAIYLDTPVPETAIEPEEAPLEPDVGAILQGVGIETIGPPPGP